MYQCSGFKISRQRANWYVNLLWVNILVVIWKLCSCSKCICIRLNEYATCQVCIYFWGNCLALKFTGRLEGMWYEAKGSWQKAEKLYSDLLTDHPSDTVSSHPCLAYFLLFIWEPAEKSKYKDCLWTASSHNSTLFWRVVCDLSCTMNIIIMHCGVTLAGFTQKKDCHG